MKKIFLLALLVFSFGLSFVKSQVLIPQKSERNSYLSLNGIWKFRYIPSLEIGKDSLFYLPGYNIRSWSDIKVPGCWEMQGFAEPEYGGSLKEGTGLYLTEFIVPDKWNGNKIYIAFDGVCYGYDFWINGKPAGSFASSYNRQTFDISGLILKGKLNKLAVRVNTRPKGWEFDTNDSWSLSGIIRDVTLFGLPEVHIKDVTVKTYISDTNRSSVSVTAIIERQLPEMIQGNIRLRAVLTDNKGKNVKEFSVNGTFPAGKKTMTLSDILSVTNPSLWTAETPYLYNLRLTLSDGEKDIQSRDIKVGIRQLTIENRVIKLNGQPIKLRGINHHDLSPVNGTSMTRNEFLQDLLLMKRANINMIRTSHYPPDYKMIELCDSMGFYVIDEVPFGYDGNHLNDTSYLPTLLKRAKATVWRDKNSPSVIAWSIGNENPLTEICIKTGRYVKRIDETRPYCYPQVGSYFRTIKYSFQDDSAEVLAPHYPGVADLNEYATKFNRPFIITEYAHNFALEFDRVQEQYEIMHTSPAIAGGAVWHFHDQGIVRKSDQKVDNKKFTPYVWIDSVTYYDCATDKGTDGIVYSDRIPQSDYWQLRKVFAPVRVLNNEITLKPGQKIITMTIENRYDFTDLSEGRIEWELISDTSCIHRGVLKLSCSPHDTVDAIINLQSPFSSNSLLQYMRVKFFDRENYQFYERSVNLVPEAANLMISLDLQNQTKKKSIGLKLSDNGMINLSNPDRKPLITDGPYLRVGRKLGLINWVLKDDTSQDSINISTEGAWFPHYLKSPEVISKVTEKNKTTYTLSYRRGKSEQKLEGTICYTQALNGGTEITYIFKPKNAKGFFLEAGLSFLVSSELTEFRWIGKGPFPSYPGKSALDEFGIYHMNYDDINYQGNRSGVKIALVTDKKGNGFAIVGNDANIALEKTDLGILFSHNALVSGRYSKKSLPVLKYDAEKVKEISGSFTVYPLSQKWPEVLIRLFGNPSDIVKPFNPYYHSYDQ
jgi:beta-galactosidase